MGIAEHLSGLCVFLLKTLVEFIFHNTEMVSAEHFESEANKFGSVPTPLQAGKAVKPGVRSTVLVNTRSRTQPVAHP